MTLTLTVDGDRWRAHLRATLDADPDLVPVIKGNGYGFGNRRLARKAAWLGADTVAVGTYRELADVASRCDADLVVLSPWRPFETGVPAKVDPDRVVHTVGRLEDLAALLATDGRPRVLLERLTSMKRHGFSAQGLREATAMIAAHTDGPGVRLEGTSLHLPLGDGSNLIEASDLLTDVVAAGLARADDRGPATVWVSHLDAAALTDLRAQYPDLRFRQRVGTGLWLGDRGALRVTARVLDVHPVERGESYGYRGRTPARGGHLIVVSGGTAHGIGLEAPTGEVGLRSAAGSLARGGLDAVGRARSPFTVAGKARYFAEPPHMQASMLFLPAGSEPPAVGEEIEVRVRFTATTFDDVELV